MKVRVVVRHSPPFSRRGGCAINKKIPFLSVADGVVIKFRQKIRCASRISIKRLRDLLITTPSAPLRNGVFFIEAQPLLLENGGDWACSNDFPLSRSRLLWLYRNIKVVECS